MISRMKGRMSEKMRGLGAVGPGSRRRFLPRVRRLATVTQVELKKMVQPERLEKAVELTAGLGMRFHRR